MWPFHLHLVRSGSLIFGYLSDFLGGEHIRYHYVGTDWAGRARDALRERPDRRRAPEIDDYLELAWLLDR
jgi:hypothetical protein